MDKKKISQLFKKKPIVREHKKVGRNEKCPCGSNLKYKKCCLNMITNLKQEIINKK